MIGIVQDIKIVRCKPIFTSLLEMFLVIERYVHE